MSLKAIPFHEFIALRLPERGHLLEPWLPEKGLAMVYAPRGVGKTWFALSVGFAVGCGMPFLGFRAPSQKRVVYLDGEMPAFTMQERLRAIRNSFGRELESDNSFRIMSGDLSEYGLPDLSTPEGQLQFDRAFGDEVDLIIVDNISTLCRSGKENEAEGWLPVQEWALAQRRRGRTVLFVHHSGKRGSQRGTSRREDVLDTVVALRRPVGYSASEGGRFEVQFEKTRGFFGPDAEPFEAKFETDADAVRWSRCGIQRDTKAVQAELLLRERTSVRKVAAETGLTRYAVDEIKQRLIDRGELEADDLESE